jgi:hypothetical protein
MKNYNKRYYIQKYRRINSEGSNIEAINTISQTGKYKKGSRSFSLQEPFIIVLRVKTPPYPS